MELQGCHGNQSSEADQGRKYHLALNTKKASTHTGLLSVNSKINSILGCHVSPERAEDGLSFTCSLWSDLDRAPQELRIHQLSPPETKSLSNPELKREKNPSISAPTLSQPLQTRGKKKSGTQGQQWGKTRISAPMLRKHGVAPTQGHPAGQ